MNSCIYQARVMHHRLEPKKHRFNYGIYLFYIDLDELELLEKNLWMFSRNTFNFFSFRDQEHLQLSENKTTTKENILSFLEKQGKNYPTGRIMLLTNLNVLGYNFNPVSFYFGFDHQGNPLYCVAEVSNTFGEMKTYLLGEDCLENGQFRLSTKKYFYVSPFIDHDVEFQFKIQIPGDKLNIQIDDYKNGKRFFLSNLSGKKRVLSNLNLIWYSLRFPFITLRIIMLIHWNALLLWLKKLPYHPKAANQELQKDVYNKYPTKG